MIQVSAGQYVLIDPQKTSTGKQKIDMKHTDIPDESYISSDSDWSRVDNQGKKGL